MHILLIILLCLAGLVALFFLIALFAKKDYMVVRSTTIDRPQKEVFDYIKYLRNQNEYSKWANMDPDMKKTFSGTDATPGFISAWDSQIKNVGKGEQEITKIDDSRVDYELRFKKPWESVCQSYMAVEDAPGGKAKVSWSVGGKMPYPMNMMMLFMNMDKMMGNDLQAGLENLKRLKEK